MTTRRTAPFSAGTSTPSTARLLAAAVFSVFGLLLLAGCGGGGTEGEATGTTAEGLTTTAPAVSVDLDPSQLGEAIGDVWVEAIEELNALLSERPDAAAVGDDVRALKEKHIEKLVGFGRQRASLGASEQASVNAAVRVALSAAAAADWYAEYTDTQAHYLSSDQEFSRLLSSFNILTQYADFELLKQQEPDEAARLGIE